jgi:hypothetical protein
MLKLGMLRALYGRICDVLVPVALGDCGPTRSIEERFLHCVGRHLRGSEGGKERRPTAVEMTGTAGG